MTDEDFNARVQVLLAKEAELFPENDIPSIRIMLRTKEDGSLHWSSFGNVAGGKAGIRHMLTHFLDAADRVPASEQTVETFRPGQHQ